ncbi:MAG: hypothetical protein ACKO5A_10260 [Actinomycetota bacterium]
MSDSPSRSRARATTRAVAVVAAGATMLGGAGTAAAEPIYPIIHYRIGPNLTRSFWGAAPTPIRNAYNYGATLLNDRTNYNVGAVADNSAASVIGAVGPLPSGLTAVYEFRWTTPSNPPRPDLSTRIASTNAVIRFSSTAPLTDAQWKTVACHEWGHAGGIGERSGNEDLSCLMNPARYDQNNFSTNEVWWFNQIAG